VLWVIAAATALMTAFYMFRLMAMTFLGAYRGPAWARMGGAAALHEAARHGAPHPADPHAHGQAHKPAHEVAHGPADAGHGHGDWHGPHESPRAMTVPLMALAVGAIVAGFVGVPAVIGGNHAIEHFLEPSFTAHAAAGAGAAVPAAEPTVAAAAGAEAGAAHEAAHLSATAEIGLMLLSVGLAVLGIWLAHRFYVGKPEISQWLAQRWDGAHRLLTNKYYVDELYGATFVRGTLASARGLWRFDGAVVDGAVNGSGTVTRVSAWVSHAFDKYVVDGLVNLVGWICGEGSFVFRRLQTGLIQNYALLMLFGVFVFLSVYLFAR
jgi:NADH-quinone oxidoreductase subunit L